MSKYTDLTVKNYEKLIRNLEKVERHVKYMSQIEKYVKTNLVGGMDSSELKALKVGSVLREKDQIQLYVVSKKDDSGVMIREISKDALPTNPDHVIYSQKRRDIQDIRNYLHETVLEKVSADPDAEVEVKDTDRPISNDDLLSNEWQVVGSKKQGEALKTLAGLTAADAPVASAVQEMRAPVALEIDRSTEPDAAAAAEPTAAAAAAAAATPGEDDVITTQPLGTQPLGSAAAAADVASASEGTDAEGAVAATVPLEQVVEQSEVKVGTEFKEPDGPKFLVVASVLPHSADEPNDDTEQWVVFDNDDNRVDGRKSSNQILSLIVGENTPKALQIYEPSDEDLEIKTGVPIKKIDFTKVIDIKQQIEALLQDVKEDKKKITELEEANAQLQENLDVAKSELQVLKQNMEVTEAQLRSIPTSEAADQLENQKRDLQQKIQKQELYIVDLKKQLEIVNQDNERLNNAIMELENALQFQAS